MCVEITFVYPYENKVILVKLLKKKKKNIQLLQIRLETWEKHYGFILIEIAILR